MPTAYVKYEDQKAFDELMALGKERGFTVIDTQNGEDDGNGEWYSKISYVNGVPIIKRDPSITIDDMAGSLTGLGLDAAELRKNAWRDRE